MKISNFETKEEWFTGRLGKITGSRLKDIVVKRGTGRKIGFYELIAERIALPSDGENPMDRGTRLEQLAVDTFVSQAGKKINTGHTIWSRDDNDSIAVSPDGWTDDLMEAVEAKCLSSARHIEAFLTQEVPDEYKMQAYQYFIVNEKLSTLYFCFYDPRIPCKEFFYLTITRDSVQKEINEYLEYQEVTLKEVGEIVNKLTF